MKTKYDELCDAAKVAQDNRRAARNRCLDQMVKLVPSFRDYCGIPKKQITYLKWNGESQSDYQLLDSSTPLYEAIVFDDDDGCHVGLQIACDEIYWVWLPLFVKEKNTRPIVGIRGETKNFPLPVTTHYPEPTALYDHVIEKIRDVIKNPEKRNGQILGFAAERT